MGSVMDTIKCPQCGGCMFSDYYYKTNEEYKHCLRCGKIERWVIECDENGKFIFKKNGKVKFKHINRKGYGSVCFTSKSGGATISALEKPLTKKMVKSFLEEIEENANELDVEKCYLTKWDDAAASVVAVYGKLPESYDDFLQGEHNE